MLDVWHTDCAEVIAKRHRGIELGSILVCEALDPSLSEEHESLAELIGPVAVDVTWFSAITYAGRTLVPGSWIYISDVEGSSHLAQVQALGSTSEGMAFIYTHTFELEEIFQTDPIDESQFAWESELFRRSFNGRAHI